MSILSRRRTTPDAPVPAALEGAGAPWAPEVHAAWSTYQDALDAHARCVARRDESQAALDAIDDEPTPSVDLDDDIDEQLEAHRARAAEQAARRIAAAATFDAMSKFADATAARVTTAARDVLRAQSRDLRTRFDTQSQALTAHRARTAELLEQLRSHDGVDYAIAATHPTVGMVTVVPMSTGQSLAAELENMRLQVGLLELAVDGLPLPTFVGPQQISPLLLPATIHGEHRIVETPDPVPSSPDLQERLIPLPAA